jgi:hypothetical protein
MARLAVTALALVLGAYLARRHAGLPTSRCYFRFRPFFAFATAAMMSAFFSPHVLQSARSHAPGVAS